MPEFELATIDWVIIAAYVLIIMGIGFWVGRGQKDSESYFLAGRGMAWWLVGFSLVITNFSGAQFLALAGAGYSTGIAVWNHEWMATIILVFFALFVLPVYLQSKIQTVPEFLGRRYDARSRKAFTRETWREESEELKGTAWYKNYRTLGIGMAVFTVAVMIPFI